MNSISFDTLKCAEKLEKTGLTREQAAAIVGSQPESLAEALDTTLATKSDVARLESRMETLERRLTIKLGAFIAVAVGILIAVLKVPH